MTEAQFPKGFHFTAKEWREGLEAANEWEFCPVDTRENTPGEPGVIGAWLAEELHGTEIKDLSADPDVQTADAVTYEIIETAITALFEHNGGRDGEGEPWFTGDSLIRVIESYRGETVDDFRTLAEEHAEENGIELMPVGDGATERDYEKWYTDNATSEGEQCFAIGDGGTLVWFDSNKW